MCIFIEARQTFNFCSSTEQCYINILCVRNQLCEHTDANALYYKLGTKFHQMASTKTFQEEIFYFSSFFNFFNTQFIHEECTLVLFDIAIESAL